MGALLGLGLIACASTIGLCIVVPEWWRERQLGRLARERLEEARRRLSTTQLQLETSRQLLLKCREQMVTRNLDEIKARDADLLIESAPQKKPADGT